MDVAAVRLWCRVTLDALGHAREEIDALNVFPVPDGDTGTNLFLTVEAAADAVETLPDDTDLRTALRSLSYGALVGARGNSGVIFSQMLKGFTDVIGDAPEPGAEALRTAFARAADLAYAAVGEPVEGTMLTVARAAAGAAARVPSGDLVQVARAAAREAREALARTPQQLDVLGRAGVVDAGGRGLTVMTDALVGLLTGVIRMPPPRVHVPVLDRTPGVDLRAGGPAFEVMYLLDAHDDDVPRLKATLLPLGDSLVVVGGEGLWNVHVHVDDVGAAIEAGVDVGRPHRIRVTHFAQAGRAGDGRGRDRPPAGRAVVALAPGPGLASLLRDAGALVVQTRPGRRPSTRQLLEAIQATHAREVVVLPNHVDSHAVAEAAAEQARADGTRVTVIPTVASVQALAALAVAEPGRRFDDDVVAMTSAAGATRYGEITVASEESITMAGLCHAGDVLGLIEGDVVVIGTQLGDTAGQIIERMLHGGGELVTLISGQGVEEDLVPRLATWLHASRPDVECVTYEGGQPDSQLLVGVE
jgi:DAK2 domain fusion protein YloV